MFTCPESKVEKKYRQFLDVTSSPFQWSLGYVQKSEALTSLTSSQPDNGCKEGDKRDW